MNIDRLEQFARQQLRKNFDNADEFEAMLCIDLAKDIGFDDLAAEMQQDLDFERRLARQKQKDLEEAQTGGFKK
jgi:hypothetical protein